MKKLVSLFLALVLALSVSVVAYADTSSAVNQARRGVAALRQETYITDGSESMTITSSGSGYFVGAKGKNPEYFVTCAHCVADYANNGRGEVITLDGSGKRVNASDSISEVFASNAVLAVQVSLYIHFSENDFVEAYLVAYDEQMDTAVLRIENPTDKKIPLALSVPTEDIIGDHVYALGFPGSADDKNNISRWGESDITVTTGVASRLVTNSSTGRREIQNDVKVNHGNSGGPLVNSKGNVLGIVSNGYSNEYYAVSVLETIALLNQAGLKEGTDYVVAGGSGNALMIVLIAVGALFIIGLIVLIVVLSSKKGGKGGKGGRMIVGQAGALAGKSFVLKRGQKMVVGRNPDCQIRFPADTQGVSKVHCSITFDGEKVYVRDEGSSMGTYIGDTKVEAHKTVSLHRGQPLYVGSKSQILVLRSK